MRSSADLELGHVRQRADHPHHLAVGADNRPRFQNVPEIMPVRSAQSQIVIDPARALMQKPVERAACNDRDREDAARRASPPPAPRARRASARAGFRSLRCRSLRRSTRSNRRSPRPIRSSPASAARRRGRCPWRPPEPEKANCITVKPISMTISTRPPTKPGAARSLVR